MIAFDSTDLELRYGKRLAIVVPYRDRSEHLGKFVPHMITYFQRDKLDRQIRYSIHVVEQSGRAAFNRGKIKNCGFVLAKDSADYICFHDVDYLPLWADYSWSSRPARLAWHGLTLKENWSTFFGAVVLFDKATFERVNGYPNGYWGWGPEDTELGERCRLAGFDFERRDGTYMPLPHPSTAFNEFGNYTEEAKRTTRQYAQREPRLRDIMMEDGLSSLEFKLLRKTVISVDGQALPDSFHYVVDIGEPD